MDLISEIYNSTLLADKPFVDECIAAIKAEIDTRVEAASEQFFDFDLTDLIGDLPTIQQSRIKDQIIVHFRLNGIRATMTPYYVSSIINESDLTPPTEPSPFLIMKIRWYTRNAREYMKTYV